MTQKNRKITVTYQEIDALFPFIVLLYGAMMTFVLNNNFLWNLAKERFPQPLLNQMSGHRVLALVCLVVGSLWSLQQIWIS